MSANRRWAGLDALKTSSASRICDYELKDIDRLLEKRSYKGHVVSLETLEYQTSQIRSSHIFPGSRVSAISKNQAFAILTLQMEQYADEIQQLSIHRTAFSESLKEMPSISSLIYFRRTRKCETLTDE
jgi:hypothetical protein